MVNSGGERQSSAGACHSVHSRHQSRRKFAKWFALRIGRIHSVGLHPALFSRCLGSPSIHRFMPSDFLVRALSRRRDFCAQAMGHGLARVSEPQEHAAPLGRRYFHCD